MKNIKLLIIFYFLFFTLSLNAIEFKVASYNVENLFDLNNDGTEYKEYKPYTRYWNKKALNTKLNNITRVIKDIDADIISLQEIESKKALSLLLKKLKKYKHSYFLKNKNSAIGLAILSKFPIIKNQRIKINNFNKHSRPILKSTISINNHKLIVYTNHWKSKRSAESTRIPYAQSLIKDINKLNKDDDYIILGDLNSNYDEYLTFKNDRRLNDTQGITGINQVLNTSINENLIKKSDIINEFNIHYNLWNELDINDRFSNKYMSNNNTPDNMIVGNSLFNSTNISYVNNSFKVFKKPYLYNKRIKRWNMKKQNGFSDHLPIYAMFSTLNQNYKTKIKTKNIINTNTNSNSINSLYNIQKLNSSINLKNVSVIYKYKNSCIIKKEKQKAILIYKKANKLKLGYIYDIKVNKIVDYYGLKEISNISNIIKKSKNIKYKNLFLDGKNIDITDLNYQNEIITNLSGVYKKKHLHFNDKKIYLFFDKNIKKPKQNSKIQIINAHLSIYKNKMQISIHKQSDFKALYR